MKQTIRVTESELNHIIKEALNELDWKTYMRAARKREDQMKQNGFDDKTFNKMHDLEKMANQRFDDEYIGLMKYDTMGDKIRGKHSPTFNGKLYAGSSPYGKINGYNKNRDKIFSTDKDVYHTGAGGVVNPSNFFRDKEVGDKFKRANDEAWDEYLGNYEYQKGQGWVKKDANLDESITRAIRKLLH